MTEVAPAVSEAPSADKSAAVAYALWFFLGGFGAHRFYCGRTSSGMAMLGLCLASAVTSVFLIGLIGVPVLFVWWLVDAFQMPKWLKPPAPQQERGMMFPEPPAAAA